MFTSRRERRLWIYAGLVVLAIYSTVVWSGALAEMLGKRHLLNATFMVAFIVLVGAVVGDGLSRRP